MSDEAFLRRAIDLAAEARAKGEMPYGSLLVGPSGEVLAEGTVAEIQSDVLVQDVYLGTVTEVALDG